MELEAYELVILRRPPNPASYDDDTLDRLQREHLDYGRRLREDGITVTQGPVVDQPDESMRGLVFYRVGSVAEARRIAEQDPSVLAGRLIVEAMEWWCPPGTMTKPGRPITVPDP